MNKFLQNVKIQAVATLLLMLFFVADSFGQVTTLQNWTNIYEGTSTNAQTSTYNVTAGTGSNRLLVVAIASTTRANSTNAVTLTYGGQPLVSANSDISTNNRQHTAIYYLNEAGLDAATNSTLSCRVQISSGSVVLTSVWAAVFDYVDQSSPITNSRNFNSSSNTNPFVLGTNLSIAAGDQAILVANSCRTGSTTARTFDTYANFNLIDERNDSYNTNPNGNDIGTRFGIFNYSTIPTSAITSNCSITLSGTSLPSMTAVSINACTAPTVDAGNALAAICQGGTSAPLGGSRGGSSTGATWSSNAGGTFSPNATTLNATWTPPTGYSGTATLTLTTSGGSCGVVSASKTQVVNPIPTVVTATASATNICSGATINLTSSATGNSSTTVVNSSSPNLSIPDNDLTNGVTSQITLPCASANEITTVTLDITHTYTADLRVYLISPNGTQRSLCVEKGGSADNILATFQAGAQALPTGNTAINGTYAPEQSFSGFSGTAAGIWTLRVFDDAAQDIGTLNSWSITVNSATCGVVTYAWTSSPAGFTSAVQNPTGVSSSGTVTYTVTATNSYGCSASASTAPVVAGATTTRTNNGWTNGEPTNTKAVIFDQNYTIAEDLNACSITVNPNVNVIVQSNKTVTLEGAVNVETGGSFTLNNNAALLQNGTTNPNTDAIVVKRNSSAIKRLDYTLWSSPVAGQGVYAFSPTTLKNRFYTYNTATDAYSAVPFTLTNLQYPAPMSPSNTNDGINGTDTSNIQFATAKGYLIRTPWNHPTSPAVFAGQFTGVPNSGDITVQMSLAGAGYNAVGNPYPSKLNVAKFIDGNPNITGTLYFWRKTNNANTTTYAMLTKMAYAANPTVGGDTGTGFFNTSNGNAANWVINVGQGFFVQANTANNELYFNNDMRRGSSNDNQFFRTNGENEDSTDEFITDGIYWLNLSDATNPISQMAVGYSQNATLDFDRGIDGKNINNDMYLASLINGEDYAIQGRSSFVDTDEVPLSFKVATAGNYTISIDQSSGIFSQGQVIYLKDNVQNTIHNLSESGAYNFTTAAGTFAERFEVVYANSALGVDKPTFNENQVVVYKNENSLFVVNTGSVEMSSIKVFDIRGRLLTTQNNINASQTSIQVDVPTQVLLLQITSLDGVVVTKKVIK